MATAINDKMKNSHPRDEKSPSDRMQENLSFDNPTTGLAEKVATRRTR